MERHLPRYFESRLVEARERLACANRLKLCKEIGVLIALTLKNAFARSQIHLSRKRYAELRFPGLQCGRKLESNEIFASGQNLCLNGFPVLDELCIAYSELRRIQPEMVDRAIDPQVYLNLPSEIRLLRRQCQIEPHVLRLHCLPRRSAGGCGAAIAKTAASPRTGNHVTAKLHTHFISSLRLRISDLKLPPLAPMQSVVRFRALFSDIMSST